MKKPSSFPISRRQLAANRACPPAQSRPKRSPSPKLVPVTSEPDDDLERITADLVRLYQPIDRMEMFPIESIALTRRNRIRVARAKSALLADLGEKLRMIESFEKHLERRERSHIEHLRRYRSLPQP